MKSLQKGQNSTNLLLWPLICRKKPAITPNWFNSLDTNSRNYTIICIMTVNANYLNRLYLRARQCTTSSCFAWLWQQDRGKVARNPRLSLSFLQILQKCTIRFVFRCKLWKVKLQNSLDFAVFLFVYIYIKKIQLSSAELFIKYNLEGGLRSARTESIVCKWTYRNNWLKIAKPF